MGFDPLTIGLGLTAASSIYGAFNQNKTNQQNRDAQINRQGQVDSYVNPFLQGGTNPYSTQLLQMLGITTPQAAANVPTQTQGGPGRRNLPGQNAPPPPAYAGPMFKGPADLGAFTYDPTLIDTQPIATGTQGFNSGQDAYMQLLRSGGSPFDTSKLFDALAPLDDRALGQQVAALRGGAGSLGARFGTATMDREKDLRSQFLQNTTARNAGLQMQSYESAQARALAAAGGLQQGGLSQMGLLAQVMGQNAGYQNQAGQYNAGARTQAGQFNAAQTQAWNTFMSQILGQAAGLQSQQQSQNAQLLAIQAGLPPAQVAPSAWPQAGGDIGQMLMFLPFLQQAAGGGNRAPVNYPTMPNAGPYYIPGATY